MTTFTDDFNRANSTNLGANWVEVSGDWSIVSNQLAPGTSGATIVLRAATAMATSDNYAQVTIAATTALSQGVWCRGNSDLTSGYLWRNNGTNWSLFSVVGGTFTSIGSFTAAAAPGDVAKVQAVGSTIKGFVNGVQRVSVTDTAVATGTSVGIRSDSTSLIRFDDFSAGDVTTGTTGDAALSSTTTLTATGLRATAGSAALASTASLAASGDRSTSGAAGIAAEATLAADGATGANGNGALTATADLAASGQRAAIGDSALAATADLTAQGQTDHIGGAALTVVAAVTAAGATVAASDAALAVTAVLTAGGTTISAHEDSDITVGAPYGAAYTADAPQSGQWEVGAPW